MAEQIGQAEQLIILGNGFDLRCGLKSAYKDFYLARYKSEAYKEKITLLYSENLEDFSKQSFRLNIWDIILCEVEDVKSVYWKDIEEIIKKYVIKLQPVGIVDNISRALSKIPTPSTLLNSGKIFVRHPNSTFVQSYEPDNFFKLFDENFEKDNFFAFLMSELKKFEKEFSNYLKGQVENENNKGYQEKSNDVLNKLISIEGFDDNDYKDELLTKIITFNYTFPFETCENNTEHFHIIGNQEGTEIYRIQNVHGKLSHDIVFGIDRNTEHEKLPDSAIPFTKTYRSLSVRQSHHHVKLFSKGTKIIKFYGHSLGEMDYTYFKIIFDNVDLVNGDVQLIFFFSLYDKHTDENNVKTKNTPEDDDAIREENYKRIDNLIRRYEDETMGKDSDVLLHKLRLEGRLLLLEEGLYWNIEEKQNAKT